MLFPSVLRRLCLAVLGVSLLADCALAWTPPIGIPAPAFGIDQAVSDTAFTHWVDNSGACSDALGRAGTPASPRCTIPDTLPAGSIVQVRGGPYSIGHETWELNGTAAQPVYVRGPSTGPRPYLGNNADIEMTGQYAIVENLRMRMWTFADGGNHHLALRLCEVTDHPGTGAAVGVGENTHHIVIYGCEIARNGSIPSSPDQHGVNLYAPGIHDVWIVDNHIHHNSGDAIQFCHGCNDGGPNDGPANVYIGRNVMHEDEENALDLKEFQGPVIISQNRMYGYVEGLDSSGDAVRINDEGRQGALWILFNDIWWSNLGINMEEADANPIFVVGNEVHDIFDTAIFGEPLAGSAAVRVINNTVINVADGIMIGEIRSNIVQATGTAIGAGGGGCSHNLVQQGDNERVCTNGRTGNPLLARSGAHVTGLLAGSPALETGFANHAAYSTFQSTFGQSIQFDRVGVGRPQGAGWDMGAHELPADLVFRDGFESGNFTRWSSSSLDGGDLSVTGPGMAGTVFGMTGVEDDTVALFVQDNTPVAEPRYRARFYVDATQFDPGTAQGHLRTRIFLGFSSPPDRRVAAIVLRKLSGQFSVMGRARLDDDTQADTGFFALGSGAHVVEFELSASTPGGSNGTFSLWIDGTLVRTLTGLANSAGLVDFVRMGALSLKSGVTGALRFDEFESRKQSYIGPLP